MARPNIRQLETDWRRLEEMTLQQLYLLRAHHTCEQGMLGNIPLLVSTVPLIFLIFGSHLTEYLPSDNFGWLLAVLILIVAVIWSLTHHFQVKGKTACDLYLIDTVIWQKEKAKGGNEG